MKMSRQEIDQKAHDLLRARGPVVYNTTGMAPPAGAPVRGPYVTAPQLARARALAGEKLAYLTDSRDPEKTKNPEAFLDLRDGGTDRAGLAGRPVMTGSIIRPGCFPTRLFLKVLNRRERRSGRTTPLWW